MQLSEKRKLPYTFTLDDIGVNTPFSLVAASGLPAWNGFGSAGAAAGCWAWAAVLMAAASRVTSRRVFMGLSWDRDGFAAGRSGTAAAGGLY